MAFYARRVAYWRGKMGAERTAQLRTARVSCPLYLAHVLQDRAYSLRAYYPKWWKRHIGITVERLNQGLAHTGGISWLQSNPMRGTGESLEHWGRYYGVSPYFMAAAAATESSLGIAACSNNRYNVWGLSSCGSGWHVPAFASWDEAIRFYARFLSSRWPSHSTPYSFTGYAACSPCWGRKVSEWMNTLFGVPAVTRYP